jgi:hypothetical protein
MSSSVGTQKGYVRMRSRMDVAVGIAALGVLCSPALAEIVVSIDPVSQTTTLGSAVNVEAVIAGLGGFSPPALGAFDVIVGFDPAVLQFVSATFGDPTLGDQLNLLGLGSITISTLSYGSVDLFELSLDSIDELNELQAPTFALGTLGFDAVGNGTSPLTISVNALSDAYGDELAAVTRVSSVDVGTVPEPGSLFPPLLLVIPVLFVHASKKRSDVVRQTFYRFQEGREPAWRSR